MVVAVERAVGPPSTMRGILLPNCSRTQLAWVHSGRPRRLAEVAVMGRPSLVTTAREMAASGTRRATLPVLAVTRRGSLEPALTMMVRGPGQNFSARRSKAVSISRARSYACSTWAMRSERGLWRARVLIS